jgi:hypothetical protein
MPHTPPTRRTFCIRTTLALLGAPALLRAETGIQTAQPHLNPIHPNVAAVDHDRILTAANALLDTQPIPITSLRSPHSPASPNDFYSEPDDLPSAFTVHRDALFTLSRTVATLTAAYVLTAEHDLKAPRYATLAADHLRTWFLTPATRINPNLQYGQRTPNTAPGHFNGSFKGLIEAVPLAEVAQSIPFLASSSALTSDELTTIHTWFADYLKWLLEDPLALLARDQKDHNGSGWLLQATACAHLTATGLTSDDTTLNTLRHRFRTVTLRAQVHATGKFPQEVASPNPYRNSLFNLDLLTAACDLLSTRFESVWDYELQDGPGLRTAIAFHAPYIANRSSWPYPADAAHFTDLPGRRTSLLLAGRAYSYPQYTEEWQSLLPIPDTAPAEIRRSDPLSQPLLWITRPKPTPAP